MLGTIGALNSLAGPPPVDPFILFPFEEANGSLAFTSTNALYSGTCSRDAYAQISTVRSKTGSSCLHVTGFAGASSIAPVSTTGFSLGSGDFSITMDVYRPSTTANVVLMGWRTAANAATGAYPNIGLFSGNLRFWLGTGTNLSFGTSLTANTWVEVKVTRISNTVRLFLDNTQVATSTISTDFSSFSNFRLGSDAFSPPQYAECFIDNVVITTGGVEQINLGFEGTNGAQTTTDASPQNRTMTFGAVTTFSEVSNTRAFTGSRSLFSNTNFIANGTVAPARVNGMSLGAGNFSLTLDVYRPSTSTTIHLLGWRPSNNAVVANQPILASFSGTLAFWTASGTVISFGSNPTADTWVAIKVERISNVVRIYYNNVQVGTATISTDFTSWVNMLIGTNAFQSAWSSTPCYIDNLRLSF